MLAAIAFVSLLALLCVFQVALAFGAPWGRFAWGGQHEGKLPTGLRVGSAVSTLVYALIAVVALDRAGVIDLFADAFSHVAMWVIFGFLALGVVMNAISRSRHERLVMTPVAFMLAGLALLIALSSPTERTGTFTILDNGTGAVLCEGGVMESYPPQCRGPVVTNWNWNEWPHEEASGVRWGDYSLTVTRDGDGVHVAFAAWPTSQ